MLSVQGWVIIGGSIDLVAETFFGTAEGVKRAENNLIALSEVANNQFAKALKAFDEGGDLAESFDINLGELGVTADSTSNSMTKLASTTTKSGKAMKEATVKLTESQKSIEHVFTNAFKNMENSIVDFSKTGKFAFGDFVSSFVEDLLRMVIQLQLTIPLMNSLKSMIGGGTSFFSAGGAVSSGVTAFASGGVVSSPTLFPMATGVGLMGEAGAEAIMPLTRTSSGNLGVEAQVSPVQVNVNNYGSDEVSVQQDEAGKIDIIISKVVSDITRGGSIGSAIEGRYGVRKQ